MPLGVSPFALCAHCGKEHPGFDSLAWGLNWGCGAQPICDIQSLTAPASPNRLY